MTTETVPSPVLQLRGRGFILFLIAYLTLASLFFLYSFSRSATQWLIGQRETIWVAGDLIRAVAATAVTALLWRYANALKRHRAGQSANLESAHLALWRWVAVLVTINLVYLVFAATRPAIQVPAPTPVIRSTEE